jgi:hypothetical protein
MWVVTHLRPISWPHYLAPDSLTTFATTPVFVNLGPRHFNSESLRVILCAFNTVTQQGFMEELILFVEIVR